MESGVEFDEDELLLVDLPFVGPVEARVVWREGRTCGCEFTTPISKAVVSAALLRSPFSRLHSDGIEIEELEIAVSPTLEQMTAWEVEFEKSRAKENLQLLGFRQRSDGMIIAMVKRGD